MVPVAVAPEDAVALVEEEEEAPAVLLAAPVAASVPPALVLGGNAVLACEDYSNFVSCQEEGHSYSTAR